MVLLQILCIESSETEISIEAARALAWNVLTNCCIIKEWNKILIPIQGSLKQETQLNTSFTKEATGMAYKI